MSELIGLGVFALIVAGFVALFFWTNAGRRVEINAEFARERGWQFEDRLPQLGRAQRQHILRGTSADGLAWELTLNLAQSNTTTVPATSTIWQTAQVRSAHGLVLIGPQLDKSFDTLDFSHPLLKMGLQMMLGDTAEQVPDLQRVPMPDQAALTILATDAEYARQVITAPILEAYGRWMQTYRGKERVPICVLRDTSLEIKVQAAFTKAADLDAFVALCLDMASRLTT